MNIPTWGLLALLAPLLFSIVNLLDQTILLRYKLTPWIYFALDGFIGILPIVIILGWFDSPFLIPKEAIALALFSGVALAGFNILYFHALQLSDVTIIVILMQTTPVFSLVWGLTLLHERYEALTYVGMFLLLLGASVAAVSEKKENNTSVSQALFTKTLLASLLMLMAAFALSIVYLLKDIALRDASVLSVFFWQRFCLVLISSLIIMIRRKEIKELSPAPIVLTSLVEVIVALALLSITAALSMGPLAIVSFLSSVQPVWVWMLVWILSSTKPRVFPTNEDVSRFKLIVACALVIMGLYFMRLE